jgi:hypothetical protein
MVLKRLNRLPTIPEHTEVAKVELSQSTRGAIMTSTNPNLASLFVNANMFEDDD